jgi:hypothetical protein
MVVETSKGSLPVRYGMNALAKYGDLTGKTMNQVFDSLSDFKSLQLSELLVFVYVGFVDGARFAEEECKIKSIEEIGDMLDDDGGLLQKIINIYQEEGDEPAGDEPKKK